MPSLNSPQLKRLREHLSERTLSSYWDAGALLDDAGSLSGIAEQLHVSENLLGKVRLLRRTWDRGAINQATRARMPFRIVVQLLYLETSTHRHLALNADKQQRRRERLIELFAKFRNAEEKEKAATWADFQQKLEDARGKVTKKSPQQRRRRLTRLKAAIEQRSEGLQAAITAAQATAGRRVSLNSQVKKLKDLTTDVLQQVEPLIANK